MTNQEIKENAPSGAQYYNDEFEENGDVVYLRRSGGAIQYFDYKNEWSTLLFSMPCKPL